VLDTEVGLDSTNRCVLGERLHADNCSRRKQRPITVHDSSVLAACLRTSHAGMYTEGHKNLALSFWLYLSQMLIQGSVHGEHMNRPVIMCYNLFHKLMCGSLPLESR